MADTTYAGETSTIIPDFGKRVAGAVKRAFASVIEAREREAKRRIKAYPPFMNTGSGKPGTGF
jgi:hypothetical protein